ncbi:MAG: hypothetical protein RLZZ136_940 [Pseudomonadota bacterium]|jgi:hypothetical protein
MPYDPPPNLAGLSLTEIAALAKGRKLPPVENWHPDHRGDSEMRVAADGKWYHQGGEITRPAMVRAFSALLRRDAAGQHWLVTPHEMLAIAVDDAAFIAVDVVKQNGALAFRLNTDDTVLAGPANPITARGNADVPALYLAVRHGCEARLNRSTYAQLIEIALESDNLTVTSQGTSFSLVPA